MPKAGCRSTAQQPSDAYGRDLLATWWIDPVTSLGIVWFVLREAREAWSGEDCCSHA
jgi:hypothetical protein